MLAAADEHARALAQNFWDTRREFEVELTPVEEAIRLALETEGGPVVLAESSDSTGSGSPGDSTGVLKHLLKAPLTGPAAIFLVDPDAVKTLAAAGPGATVTLSMGGKYDTLNSEPVLRDGAGAHDLRRPLDAARARLQPGHRNLHGHHRGV